MIAAVIASALPALRPVQATRRGADLCLQLLTHPQLADDPIEYFGLLMEAPSDLADTVPLGYGQLTSPLDQIASVAGGRAGTNFNHIPDGTVSIR